MRAVGWVVSAFGSRRDEKAVNFSVTVTLMVMGTAM